MDIRNHLDAVFSGRWIGWGGPIPWPTRSPDLSLLHYSLWEYLKSFMFETPVETDMELVARIEGAYDIVKKHTRNICQGAVESFTPMECLH